MYLNAEKLNTIWDGSFIVQKKKSKLFLEWVNFWDSLALKPQCLHVHNTLDLVSIDREREDTLQLLAIFLSLPQMNFEEDL